MTNGVDSRTGEERIGVIFVHEIGEQKRFEHLEGELRQFIDGLRQQLGPGGTLSIEVPRAEADAHMAPQPSWLGGGQPTVRVHLAGAAPDSRKLVVEAHEVWWADVNEPYSVMKQVRFWLWGMTVWRFPKKRRSYHDLAQRWMHTLEPTEWEAFCARAKILLASTLFLLASFSLGLFLTLVSRVFGVQTPSVTRTFTNFLSSIKLYNQKQRTGLGVPGDNADFFDAMGCPPRVSIRRRMVEAIVDVAEQDYSRWYVLAHSLGSVVAFNGLMEQSYVLANYLDSRRAAVARSNRLLRTLPTGDRALPQPLVAGGPIHTTPPRPSWINPNEVIDRVKLFEKFRGLVTYGSPIGKFGAIWPARVPTCRQAAFHADARWVNVFDPLDPVAGVSSNFDRLAPIPADSGLQRCPGKVNVGFAASWILLDAHVKYLKTHLAPRGQLCVDLLARWVVQGTAFLSPGNNGRFFEDKSGQAAVRRGVAFIEGLIAFLGIGSLTLVTLRWGVCSMLRAFGWLPPKSPAPHCSPGSICTHDWQALPGRWLMDVIQFYRDNILVILGLIVAMAVICLIAGIVAPALMPAFRPDQDSEPPPGDLKAPEE